MEITSNEVSVRIFRQQFEEVQSVHKILNADMTSLFNELQECKDMDRMQHLLRSFIRCLFAMVEGNAWGMKQLALAAPVPSLLFTDEEIAKINEERVKTLPDGTEQRRPKFLPTIDNLLFGFEVMAKSFDVPTGIDINSTDFEAMKLANDRRNRLVHPRKEPDLILDTSDLETLVTAFQWYLRAYRSIYDRSAESLNAAMRRQGIIP